VTGRRGGQPGPTVRQKKTYLVPVTGRRHEQDDLPEEDREKQFRREEPESELGVPAAEGPRKREKFWVGATRMDEPQRFKVVVTKKELKKSGQDQARSEPDVNVLVWQKKEGDS